MTRPGPGEPEETPWAAPVSPQAFAEPWLQLTPEAPPPGPVASPPGAAGPPQAWLPRPYPQLLRGPRHHWWRPLLSLVAGVLAAVVAVAALIAASGVYYVVMRRAGASPTSIADDAWDISPEGMLITNLLLAALIPVTMVAVWAGFGWRPRWLASVQGGVRWRWLGTCAVVAVLTLVMPSLVLILLTEDIAGWKAEPQWPALLAVILLTTPLQAAGEEYLFRGWLPQVIGSVIPNAVVGGALGVAVSSTLFAMAHGEQDPWLFADRFAFGAVAALLVWRTGGLEASIALHAVNNLTAFGITIAQGELADAVTGTEADPATVILDVGTLVVTALVVVLFAWRGRIVRLFVPPPPPQWPGLSGVSHFEM